MRYMLLICHDDSFQPPATMVEEAYGWVAEMVRRACVRLAIASARRATPRP